MQIGTGTSPGLCCTKQTRCRLEHMERLRRTLEREHTIASRQSTTTRSGIASSKNMRFSLSPGLEHSMRSSPVKRLLCLSLLRLLHHYLGWKPTRRGEKSHVQASRISYTKNVTESTHTTVEEHNSVRIGNGKLPGWTGSNLPKEAGPGSPV